MIEIDDVNMKYEKQSKMEKQMHWVTLVVLCVDFICCIISRTISFEWDAKNYLGKMKLTCVYTALGYSGT